MCISCKLVIHTIPFISLHFRPHITSVSKYLHNKTWTGQGERRNLLFETCETCNKLLQMNYIHGKMFRKMPKKSCSLIVLRIGIHANRAYRCVNSILSRLFNSILFKFSFIHRRLSYALKGSTKLVGFKIFYFCFKFIIILVKFGVDTFSIEIEKVFRNIKENVNL